MAEVETIPSLILAPGDCATIFAKPPHCQNASTQHSPAILTNAMLRRIPTAVPAIEEEDALPIQEHATSEAMLSPSLILFQILSPGSQALQSPNLALQSLAGKQSPCQENMDADSSSVQIHSTSLASTRSAHVAAKILPTNYEFCDVDDLVVLVAGMISELIRINDQLPLRNGGLTRFHSRTPPGISIIAYLQRMVRHIALTPPLLLSMVYYLDRLCALYPAFTVTSLTVHRFLITTAAVAAKGLSDSYCSNSTYARVGGIKVVELSLLELEFLFRVDWKILPSPEILVNYYRGLVERADQYVLEDNDSLMEEKVVIASTDEKDGGKL